MKDIVEHVARAIFKQRTGYDADHCAVHDMAWPEGEEWRNEAWASDIPAARAAIRATLQYARDNVSEEAAEAFRNAAFAYREAGEMTPAEAAASILSALLTHIEGGEKP